MATSQGTIDYLLDQLAGTGQVSARRMFGEYCLYWAGQPIALVCDDQLFLKPTSAGRALLATVVEGAPFPGARPHLLISADLWEDPEWIGRLVRATAHDLPVAKTPAKHAKPRPAPRPARAPGARKPRARPSRPRPSR